MEIFVLGTLLVHLWRSKRMQRVKWWASALIETFCRTCTLLFVICFLPACLYNLINTDEPYGPSPPS